MIRIIVSIGKNNGLCNLVPGIKFVELSLGDTVCLFSGGGERRGGGGGELPRQSSGRDYSNKSEASF